MVRKRGTVYINPRSPYVEEEVIQGLTLYEINRRPRILELSGSSTISIPTDELTAEIGCPICTSIMKETHIVAECLHRFCRACIQLCIHQGQKGCPICRTKLPSKRSLRSDPKFDGLVRALIPNLEKFDEALDNAAMTYNINKIGNLTEKAFLENVTVTKQRNKRPRKRQTQDSSQEPPTPPSTVDSTCPEFIHFQLHRHPKETVLPLLQKKFLRTQAGCTARHIIKFLRQKLDTGESKLQLCMDLGERSGGVVDIEDPVTVLQAKIHTPLKDDMRVVDVRHSPNTQILRVLERLKGGETGAAGGCDAPSCPSSRRVGGHKDGYKDGDGYARSGCGGGSAGVVIEEEDGPVSIGGLTALGGYSDSDDSDDGDDDDNNQISMDGEDGGDRPPPSTFGGGGQPESLASPVLPHDAPEAHAWEQEEGRGNGMMEVLRSLWKQRIVLPLSPEELIQYKKAHEESRRSLRASSSVGNFFEGKKDDVPALSPPFASIPTYIEPLCRVLVGELACRTGFTPSVGKGGSWLDTDVALSLRGAAALAYQPRYLAHTANIPSARVRGICLMASGATHGVQESIARALAHATGARFVAVSSNNVREVIAAAVATTALQTPVAVGNVNDGGGEPPLPSLPSTRQAISALLEMIELDGGPFVVFFTGRGGNSIFRSAGACQRLSEELSNLRSRSLFLLSASLDDAAAAAQGNSGGGRGSSRSRSRHPSEGDRIFFFQNPQKREEGLMPMEGSPQQHEENQHHLAIPPPPPQVLEQLLKEALKSLGGIVGGKGGNGVGSGGPEGAERGGNSPPPSIIAELLGDAIENGDDTKEDIKKSLEKLIKSNDGRTDINIVFKSNVGSSDGKFEAGRQSSGSTGPEVRFQHQGHASSPSSMALPQWLASLRKGGRAMVPDSGYENTGSVGEDGQGSLDDDEEKAGGFNMSTTKQQHEKPASQSDVLGLMSLFENLQINPPTDETLHRHWDRWILDDMGCHTAQNNKYVLKHALSRISMVCPELSGSEMDPLLSRHELTNAEVSAVVLTAMKIEAILSHEKQSGKKMVERGPSSSKDQDDDSNNNLYLTPFSIEMAFTAVCKAYVPRPGQPSSRSREEVSALAQNDRHEQALVANVILPRDIGVTYDMIGGLKEAKELLRQCITYPLKFPHLYDEGIAREAVKGVLLFGPPGTGKTMLAKAVATEGGATFLSVDASTIENKWLGESEKNARAVFTLARRLAPCVIYLDEVDSVLSSREKYDDTPHGTLTSVKTTLMQEWDGLCTTDDRVVVIASTNRPFDLDEAVLRRLPRRIMVDLPDLETREDILRVTMAENRVDSSVNFTEVASKLEGFTGSDIKEVCREAVVRIAHGHAEDLEKNLGEGLDLNVRLRSVTSDDFAEAHKRMTTSVSERGRELARVKEWNEEYGELQKKDRTAPSHESMYL